MVILILIRNNNVCCTAEGSGYETSVISFEDQITEIMDISRVPTITNIRNETDTYFRSSILSLILIDK